MFGTDLLRLSAVGIVFVLAGCASATPEAIAANDPFEATNRQIFAINDTLDKHVLLPTAKAYIAVVPQFARQGVHNFLVNLALPVTFANDVLQGEARRTGQTLGRFTVNSTLGIGGLFDPASKFGIPFHTEDFGQTLAVYGVGEGPYLVLPILGSDPPRDLGGQIVDVAFDPTTYIPLHGYLYYAIGRTALTVLDVRAEYGDTLTGIERNSVDYYATTRSLYRQSRNNEISNGATKTDDLPNF